MMTQTIKTEQNRGRLLLVIGCLWLLLAVGYFFYQLGNPVVAINWDTATEVNTAGFNIYRTTSPDGEFVQINQAEGLIPGEGTAVSGAAYHFVDENVEANTTYYYLLEEVEYNQTANRYQDEMLTHHVPYASTQTIIIMAIMLVLGLGLVITGLREEKII
jgi:hypothetical protein